jgi:S1-C subfamily serine protease
VRTLGALLIAVGIAATGCTDDTDAIPPVDATVTILATGCRNTAGQGIGTVVEPGLILTSAHTLAGADTIIVTDRTGTSTAARVVAFDPEMDLALLDADISLPAVPLTDDPPSTGESAGFVGMIVIERDGRFVTESVTVERRVMITTEDIHREGETRRPGYELVADIEPGDSGALLVIDGLGVGVVWSRSVRTDGKAWAIDPVRGGETIRSHLADGIPDTIDLDRC